MRHLDSLVMENILGMPRGICRGTRILRTPRTRTPKILCSGGPLFISFVVISSTCHMLSFKKHYKVWLGSNVGFYISQLFLWGVNAMFLTSLYLIPLLQNCPAPCLTVCKPLEERESVILLEYSFRRSEDSVHENTVTSDSLCPTAPHFTGIFSCFCVALKL